LTALVLCDKFKDAYLKITNGGNFMSFFKKKRISYLVLSIFFLGLLPANAMERKTSAALASDRAQIVQYANSGMRILFPWVPGLAGMEPVVSSALSLCSLQWQNGLYGHESVSDALEARIRGELKKLNVQEWQTLPIKKKSGAFFEGAQVFDTLIVCPTDQCIYVDEDFLSSQPDDTKQVIIETALKHYANNTFMKLMGLNLPFIGLKLVMTDAAKHASRSMFGKLLGALNGQQVAVESVAVPPQSSMALRFRRFGSFAGNAALDMAIGTGVTLACNRAAQAVMNRYTRSKQRTFDRAVACSQPKALAQRLLGNLVESDDVRAKSLQSRALELVDGDHEVSRMLDPFKEQLAQLRISRDGSGVGKFLVSLGASQENNKNDKVRALVLQTLINDAIALNNELCSHKKSCTLL
jgi:hypothetical protein